MLDPIVLHLRPVRDLEPTDQSIGQGICLFESRLSRLACELAVMDTPVVLVKHPPVGVIHLPGEKGDV